MTKIKCDFYRVTLPDHEKRDFGTILNTMHSSPDDSSRTVEYHDKTLLRFQHIQNDNGLFCGEMIRIQMKGLPYVAALDGQTAPILLRGDQGVAHHTAFLFDPHTRVLVIQKSVGGVAPSAFAHYLQARTLVSSIALEPVLELAAMQKLASMRRVTALEAVVDVARMDRSIAAIGRPDTMLDFLFAASNLYSPQVHVKATVGRSRKHNLGEKAKDDARAILEFSSDHPDAVRKLVVSGNPPDMEAAEPVDLLEGRMIERIDVPSSVGRWHTTSDRLAILNSAWLRRVAELHQMFSGN